MIEYWGPYCVVPAAIDRRLGPGYAQTLAQGRRAAEQLREWVRTCQHS